jgi:hypothetical protein
VTEPLRTRQILAYWLPLAATWLMMAGEGPFIAAIIARLPEARFNLAAYGVAFSFALVAESPIMMMLTAANTLVHDRQSFLALRRFNYAMNAALTAAITIGVIPPLFRFVTDNVIGLPDEVARLTHLATACLITWPAAIGYRRFYQGILVRHGLARRVAYGTVVRLTTMGAAAISLSSFTATPGAVVGGASLAIGVFCEAVATRLMAGRVVRDLLAQAVNANEPPLTTRDITTFYYPLALTSVLTLVVAPLVTFFLGRSRAPIESLAAMPVIGALLLLFRATAIAYQEIGVALIGRRLEHEREVGRVATYLASVVTILLALLVFTPLSMVWFRTISGLSDTLASFSILPTRLLLLLPATEFLLSMQRSILILSRRTTPITIATLVEALGVVAVLLVCIGSFNMVGAVAASVAILLGRLASNGYLFWVTRRLA